MHAEILKSWGQSDIATSRQVYWDVTDEFATLYLFQRGAVVNQNLTRYLDIDPMSTMATVQNLWDTQTRNGSNKEGTYAVSLSK